MMLSAYSGLSRSTAAAAAALTMRHPSSLRVAAASAHRNNNIYRRFFATKKRLEAIRKAKQRIIDKLQNAPRFFEKEYESAMLSLNSLKKQHATDAESVNMTFDVLERVVAEMTRKVDKKQLKWFSKPGWSTNLIRNWRIAVKEGQQVMTASELKDKMQEFARKQPLFRYERQAVEPVLDVLLKQESPHKAAELIQDFIDFIKTQGVATKNKKLLPTVKTYNYLIRARAAVLAAAEADAAAAASDGGNTADVEKAKDELLELINYMRSSEDTAIMPNGFTYSVVLQCLGRIGDLKNMEENVAIMKQEGLSTTGFNLADVARCYAQHGQFDKAEICLRRIYMVGLDDPKDEENYKNNALYVDSIQNILFACHKLLLEPSENTKRKALALEFAEKFFQRAAIRGVLDKEATDELCQAMTEIYVDAIQREDNVQDFLDRIELDAVKAPVLIQALGKLDMAEYADANVLQKMLNRPRAKLTTAVFNSLIGAWAKSSQSDAAQQAETVVKLMKEHPKCIKLDIQPNAVTMDALSKVTAKTENVAAE